MSRSISKKAILLALSLVVCLGAVTRGQDVPGQVSLEAQLAKARALFESMDEAGAVELLNAAIASMLPRRTDPVERTRLISAYLLRVRALFVLPGTSERVKADMEAILRLDPAYRMPGDVSQRVATKFDEIKKGLVGEIALTVRPEDATIDIDGVPIAGGSRTVALASGSYTLHAQRPGYRAGSQPVTIVAGTTQPVELTLERSSANLSLVTMPAGVEVMIGTVSHGVTAEGGAADPWVAVLAAKYGMKPELLSRKMTLSDLAGGTYRLSFRKPCFVPLDRTVPIDRLDDLALEPITLEPATGTLSVSATSAGATIFVDDAPRGAAPATFTECEGARTVELRSPQGRFIKRVNVHTGDKLAIEGQLKPAFALLSVSGLPEGFRGGEDPRVAVERALAGSATVTLFAPPPERAQKALQAEALAAGWLAYDLVGEPIGTAAKNIAPAERRDLSSRLSRAFDAQGVASVTVAGSDRSSVLVSLLAAGSAEPDVIALRPDNTESRIAATTELDATVPLSAPSIGLLAIDVLGSPGPVVVRVDRTSGAAAAGLAPGDVIVSANTRPVASVQLLDDAVKGLAPDATLSLEVRSRAATATRKVELRPVMVARALAMSDQTILFNPLLVSLRRQLTAPAGADESALRLNIAIALMRLGNWQEAKGELDRVRLPPGGGVSEGTVQFLLGLCQESLGQFAEAEAAWTAAKATDALLTTDGPPVKGLAEAGLKRLAGIRR